MHTRNKKSKIKQLGRSPGAKLRKVKLKDSVKFARKTAGPPTRFQALPDRGVEKETQAMEGAIVALQSTLSDLAFRERRFNLPPWDENDEPSGGISPSPRPWPPRPTLTGGGAATGLR